MVPVFEIKKTQDKKFHFILKAPNGEIILQSETYEAKQGAQHGINAIKLYAKVAKVVDLCPGKTK